MSSSVFSPGVEMNGILTPVCEAVWQGDYLPGGKHRTERSACWNGYSTISCYL